MAGRLSRFFKAGLSRTNKQTSPRETPQQPEVRRSASPPRLPSSSARKSRRASQTSRSSSMIYPSRPALISSLPLVATLSASSSTDSSASAATWSTPIVVVGRNHRAPTPDPGAESSSFPSSIGRSLTTDTSDLSLSCSREEMTEVGSLSASSSLPLRESVSGGSLVVDLAAPSRSRSTSIYADSGDSLVAEGRRRKGSRAGSSQILLTRAFVRRGSKSEFDAMPPSPTWTSDKLRKLDMLLSFPVPYLLHLLLSVSEGETFSTRIADYLVERGDFYAVFHALLAAEAQLTDTNFLRESSPATRLIQRLLASRLKRSVGDRLLKSQQWKRYTHSQKSSSAASGTEDEDEVDCIEAVIDYILTMPARAFDPVIALCLVVSNRLANRQQRQQQQHSGDPANNDNGIDRQQEEEPPGPLLLTADRSPVEQMANSPDAVVTFAPAEKASLICYTEQTVSSVLFLLYLCPLLVASVPGLPPSKPRVKMAKILQTLANGSTHPNPVLDEVIQRKRLTYLHFSAQLFARGFDDPNQCFSLPAENRDALKPLANLIVHHRNELIPLVEAPATWSAFAAPPPDLYLRSFVEIITAL